MMPDGNLLIAFKHTTHSDHSKARHFFQQHNQAVTCPITELNLLRVLMQLGYTSKDADTLLQDFVSRHRSRMLPCDISATAISQEQ